MKLIGNFLSPYTRRVAITLDVMGLPYEMETVMIFQNPEAVAGLNPVARIPTLVLDDGESVFESFAVLDVIDHMVAPERRLTPAEGKERRAVMQVTALAIGIMDKAVCAFYEGRFRPAEIIHQPWIDLNDDKVRGGLAALETLAAEAGAGGWLAGMPEISQADISSAVAFTFVKKVRPNLDVAANYPALEAFTQRLEATDAFKASPMPA